MFTYTHHMIIYVNNFIRTYTCANAQIYFYIASYSSAVKIDMVMYCDLFHCKIKNVYTHI